MSDLMPLAAALLAGMLLGAMYFGGLWWTVKRALASRWPARWFAVSVLLRLGLALSGFYFVAGADWKRLLACLIGFIIARVIAIRLNGISMEASHAP
jgi:F1F0 ATPase subunit 2